VTTSESGNVLLPVLPLKDLCLNGALTIGENIGDLGGASIAYKAWQLSLKGKPARVLDELWLLEPCGRDNPAPSVAFAALVVAAREVKGGHLKLELELDSKRRVAAFGVGMGSRASELDARCRAFGKLRPDRWRGGDAVELFVERLEVI